MSNKRKNSSATPEVALKDQADLEDALATVAASVPGVSVNKPADTVAVRGWQRARYWRKRLMNADPDAAPRAGQLGLDVLDGMGADEDDNPALARLERLWRAQPMSPADSAGLDWPGRYAETPRAPILDHVLEWVRRGLYPPPEMLIVLLEQHDVYLEARGRLTLEDVFYGPAAKRAGNYAARRDKEAQRRDMIAEFDALGRKGNAKTMAAELVMETHGIDRYANDFLKDLSRWRRRLCDGK